MNFRISVISVLMLTLMGCVKHPDAIQDPVPFTPPPSEPAKPPAPTETPVQQIAQNFTRVNFDYDSAALTVSAKQALDENIRLLREHPDVRIKVQGHCDERGTTEYNLSLGDRRASAVRKYLIAAGIAPSRVETISYGEEKPLIPGTGEDVWAQNRRAEFQVTSGDLSHTVGTLR